MKYRRILIFLNIGLSLILFDLSLALGTTKARFSIVYTNDIMGEVEPCG